MPEPSPLVSRGRERAVILLIALSVLGACACASALGFVRAGRLALIGRPATTSIAQLGQTSVPDGGTSRSSNRAAEAPPRLPTVRFVAAGRFLEVYGAMYFCTVLVLATAQGLRLPRWPISTLLGLLALLGLVVVLWMLIKMGAGVVQLSRATLVAMACVVGVFVLAAVAPFDYARSDTSLTAVARGAVTSPRAWGLVLLLSSLMWATTPPASAAGTPRGPAFDAWYRSQPVVPGAPKADSELVILKFNDYQCPPCRQAADSLEPVIARLARETGGRVRLQVRDYPIETECNRYVRIDVHPAACEAAVAMRLATVQGRHALAAWLWGNQSVLTPDAVRRATADVGGASEFESRYADMLKEVRADVEFAHALGVAGTPTFFINGRRIPFVPPAEFERAIRIELESVAR